ncbi:hypothetical protein ES703_51305 [subsurface metagenome]
MMKDYGLEHTQLSAEDMATVEAMGVETAEDWKAQSALSDEVITSVFDYMRVIGKEDEVGGVNDHSYNWGV